MTGLVKESLPPRPSRVPPDGGIPSNPGAPADDTVNFDSSRYSASGQIAEDLRGLIACQGLAEEGEGPSGGDEVLLRGLGGAAVSQRIDLQLTSKV